jgi:hypothetical protein
LHPARLLNLGNRLTKVDPVVVSEVVETDVLFRIRDAGLLDAFHDAVPAATDACVLVFHDGTGAKTVVCLQVTGEGRDGRHADDDFELLAILICSNATFNESSSDLVPDWVLSITRCSDEELILNIDEVLTVSNHSDICICNRVLEH